MCVFIDTNLWAYRLNRREPMKSMHISSWLAEVTRNHEVVPTDSTLVLDALIVEAAIRSRCAVLFSEDLNHGRRITGLTLCNPLLTGSASAPP